MTPRALAVLGCLLFLLLWAEGQEKVQRPQAPEKKATRESKPRVAQGMGRKAKLVAPNTLPPMNATTAPGAGKPPASILSQVVARGQFQKVPESLALRAGDALELRCRGRAVRWRYPAHLQDDEEGRLRVKHYAKFSQLLVVNATAADTGEYSCWSLQCQDSPCQEGEDRMGKTFVFFADPQELFVPTEDYYEVVQLRTNRPTLLPCQVTSPLARVTLHREFPPEEVPVDGRDISYDVRRGFTIHRSRPSYAGSLFCMASLGGVRQISTKYMLVYINYPSSAPKPTVRASGTSVRVGENFNVTCTVLGEPEVAVAFTWEYPGQKMGRPPYVRERTDLVRRGGQVRQESKSTLYMDEARDVDAGLYTCRAENLEGSASTATRVRVLPAPRGGRPG
ncbi:PREDICTED: platelet-derived growth factor receptor-like protein [Gavialis gangeticus]|uniref:platelet-derived growth factor receptor-like protein n=1 Tax=Gavialis gangeticus TaxID=94835 RepID=UPI00092F3EC4|nr:PREDICTED: platelet-derived growth factor receptor-like protein [Gavialis gangeticus]